MKFNPLGDKLLVRRGDEEETSAGGIVLPGSAAEKTFSRRSFGSRSLAKH